MHYILLKNIYILLKDNPSFIGLLLSQRVLAPPKGFSLIKFSSLFSLSKHWKAFSRYPRYHLKKKNPEGDLKGLQKSMTFNQSSVKEVLMNELSKLESAAAE